MARPTFSTQISLGNVIQLVVLMLTMAGGWFSLDNRVANNTRDLKNTVLQQREIVQRLRIAENEITRSDERFTRILEFMARINSRLDAIERQRQQGR